MKLTTVHINCPNPSGEGKETEHTGTAESIFCQGGETQRALF